VVTCVLACAVLACGGGGGDRKGVLVVQDSAVVSGNTPSSPGKSVAGGAPRRTILFLGTSLTAGLGLEPDSAYPQQVQRRIDAAGLPYQALNAGVSGETSAGLLRRLDWVLQDSAAVIVVETGANDGLRGQSVEATKVTIGEILTRIRKERPEARVVLVQMEAPTNLGTVYTRAFHAMFPALAAEHHVTLMPFLLTGVAGVVALNQGDGVHPNLAGERMVAATVWRALEPLVRWTGRPPIAPPAPKR
jgi:acyl-CoA thioesterase-1